MLPSKHIVLGLPSGKHIVLGLTSGPTTAPRLTHRHWTPPSCEARRKRREGRRDLSIMRSEAEQT